jgi:hypothetical protein
MPTDPTRDVASDSDLIEAVAAHEIEIVRVTSYPKSLGYSPHWLVRSAWAETHHWNLREALRSNLDARRKDGPR